VKFHRKKRASWRDGESATAALAALLGLFALAATALPAAHVPKCLFKAVTGWPCLTCGAFRAACALRSGRIGNALVLQPLLTALALLVAAWMAYAVMGVWAQWPRWRIEFVRGEVCWLLIGGIVAVLANWLYLIAAGR
jgi:hypothetical protein